MLRSTSWKTKTYSYTSLHPESLTNASPKNDVGFPKPVHLLASTGGCSGEPSANSSWGGPSTLPESESDLSKDLRSGHLKNSLSVLPWGFEHLPKWHESNTLSLSIKNIYIYCIYIYVYIYIDIGLFHHQDSYMFRLRNPNENTDSFAGVKKRGRGGQPKLSSLQGTKISPGPKTLLKMIFLSGGIFSSVPGGSSQDLVQWSGSPPFKGHLGRPFGMGPTTRSLGDLLPMVII